MANRLVRAKFDNLRIVIYQAFNERIAKNALEMQTLSSCPDFKSDRMTWIKPSFLWMMYRSGWATKKNQEHILKISIKRSGFEWALENSCLSYFDKKTYGSLENWKEKLYTSPVRIQWDPERNLLLEALPSRTIQIGLSGIAVQEYTHHWIEKINDCTELCTNIHQLIQSGNVDEAKKMLPVEAIYPLSGKTSLIINSD
jgi:hypothetical protein